MNRLSPDEYNKAYNKIGDIKIMIRHYLDAGKLTSPYEVAEVYHKVRATIYRSWQVLQPDLLRDDSLMWQFFGVFDLLVYAHERSRRVHRVKVLETRLPQEMTLGDLIASVQRLTEVVQDLPPDATPEDLEPVIQDFHNVKGLRELIGAADQAVESYLDAKVQADYRQLLENKKK